MRAVVVSHGELDPGDRDHLGRTDLVVAADGGARHLGGRRPDFVVGDMDSLGEHESAALARSGVRVESHPSVKDESDTELAVRRALAEGATEVVLIGALGGRLDHEVANLLLLADPELAGRVRAVRGATTARALRGPGRLALDGAPGDLVSLLPLGDVGGVRTEGLRYALSGEPLRVGPSRGLSNVIVAPAASVAIGSGVLLVIETRMEGRTP